MKRRSVVMFIVGLLIVGYTIPHICNSSILESKSDLKPWYPAKVDVKMALPSFNYNFDNSSSGALAGFVPDYGYDGIPWEELIGSECEPGYSCRNQCPGFDSDEAHKALEDSMSIGVPWSDRCVIPTFYDGGVYSDGINLPKPDKILVKVSVENLMSFSISDIRVRVDLPEELDFYFDNFFLDQEIEYDSEEDALYLNIPLLEENEKYMSNNKHIFLDDFGEIGESEGLIFPLDIPEGIKVKYSKDLYPVEAKIISFEDIEYNDYDYKQAKYMTDKKAVTFTNIFSFEGPSSSGNFPPYISSTVTNLDSTSMPSNNPNSFSSPDYLSSFSVGDEIKVGSWFLVTNPYYHYRGVEIRMFVPPFIDVNSISAINFPGIAVYCPDTNNNMISFYAVKSTEKGGLIPAGVFKPCYFEYTGTITQEIAESSDSIYTIPISAYVGSSCWAWYDPEDTDQNDSSGETDNSDPGLPDGYTEPENSAPDFVCNPEPITVGSSVGVHPDPDDDDDGGGSISVSLHHVPTYTDIHGPCGSVYSVCAFLTGGQGYYTVTYNWGDGKKSVRKGGCNDGNLVEICATHSYNITGNFDGSYSNQPPRTRYTLSVSVEDIEGNTGSASKNIELRSCIADGGDDTDNNDSEGEEYPPGINYSPYSFDFGELDSGEIIYDKFDVWNGTNGNLEYTISCDDDYIDISPIDGVSEGPDDKNLHVFSIDTSGLNPGEYNTTIFINSAPINIYFAVVDDSSNSPILEYSPGSFNFGDLIRGELDSTSFEIWNSGSGSLSYSLSESCEWLDIDVSSGNSSGEHDRVNVDIDTITLSPGFHNCDIVINSDGGSGVFNVFVNVVDEEDVEESNEESVLEISPVFTTLGLLPMNHGEFASFEVWNNGSGLLNYTLSESCNFISLDSLSGNSSGEHDIINVIVNTSNLSVGFYSCEILVTSDDGGSEVFNLMFSVISNFIDSPFLVVSPAGYDFGNISVDSTVSGSFTVENRGSGLLDYNISSDKSWLDLDTSLDNCSDEIDNITFVCDTSGLSIGSHVCNVSVNSNDYNHIFVVNLDVVNESDDEVCLNISRPVGGIYLCGNYLFDLPILNGFSLVIGEITIEAEIDNIDSVSNLSFYVDGKLKYSTDPENTSWVFDEEVFGPCNLRVAAYDSEDNILSEDEIDILIYNSNLK